MKTTYPKNDASRHGMTLVELLVVIAVMVMLIAVSVPYFKPMLESQRSAGGARAVSLALERARFRAIEEDRTFGIEFMRFNDGNAPNTSLQMRLIKEGTNFVRFSNDNFRIKVINGTIHVWEFDNTTKAWTSNNDYTEWDNHVKGGYSVQLGRQGRFYKLADGNNRQLAAPYGNLTYPATEDNTSPLSAVEFNVTQSPRSTLIPPVVLPHGTVIDMQFSGYRNPNENSNSDDTRHHSFSSFYQSTGPSDRVGSIMVMFSPMGNVDRCYYYDQANTFRQIRPHGGLFYFCVGEWDRQCDSNGNTLAEDGRNNIQTPSNFWVTVNPQNGQVRIAEMNASNDVREARKFATQHYTDIGGF